MGERGEREGEVDIGEKIGEMGERDDERGEDGEDGREREEERVTWGRG